MLVIYGSVMMQNSIILMFILMIITALSFDYLVLKEKYILMKKAEDGDLK